jgi:hypothetical protein
MTIAVKLAVTCSGGSCLGAWEGVLLGSVHFERIISHGLPTTRATARVAPTL